jgi:hypothetical protein
MNERIKELAEQAGISYLSSVHPDMWEKFAEMIVRKCASKVTCNEALNILEHFGVEE